MKRELKIVDLDNRTYGIDMAIRSVSSKIPLVDNKKFLSYVVDDDMYGVIGLNNGLLDWEFELKIGFEI